MTLSSSGITKFKSATLTETTAYQYTITFKFADSSDANKEATANIKINLYKATVIAKSEIEAMVKSMQSVSITGNGSGMTSVTAVFTFSSAAFSINTPNVDTSNISGGQSAKFSSSLGEAKVGLSLRATENYKKYFSSYSYKAASVSGVNLTLYFPLKLKGGYALSSEVAHITSDGLSIRLSLVSGQTWK